MGGESADGDREQQEEEHILDTDVVMPIPFSELTRCHSVRHLFGRPRARRKLLPANSPILEPNSKELILSHWEKG